MEVARVKKRLENATEENGIINELILNHITGMVPSAYQTSEDVVALKSEIEYLSSKDLHYSLVDPKKKYQDALHKEFQDVQDKGLLERTIREALDQVRNSDDGDFDIQTLDRRSMEKVKTIVKEKLDAIKEESEEEDDSLEPNIEEIKQKKTAKKKKISPLNEVIGRKSRPQYGRIKKKSNKESNNIDKMASKYFTSKTESNIKPKRNKSKSGSGTNLLDKYKSGYLSKDPSSLYPTNKKTKKATKSTSNIRLPPKAQKNIKKKTFKPADKIKPENKLSSSRSVQKMAKKSFKEDKNGTRTNFRKNYSSTRKQPLSKTDFSFGMKSKSSKGNSFLIT